MNLDTLDEYVVHVADARFTGAPLDTSEVNRLAIKFTKVEFKRGRAHEQLDAAGFGRELFCRSVTGWENLQRDAQPLACTEETRIWLYEKHPDLAGDVMEALDEARKSHREAQRKNSPSSLTAV